MSYILGTGYFDSGSGRPDWFAGVWLENTVLFADPLPERIIVVSVGNSHPPYPAVTPEGNVRIITLDLPGNPGHVHQLIGKSKPAKPYHYTGVTATFLAVCGIAYANECDFIYKEQDCLAFGPWVTKLYCELGGAGMIFGRCRVLGSAQSLFLVRHHFLPTFMAHLIQSGSEQDPRNLPEHKFTRLMAEMPECVRYCSFGYDRDRPLNMDDGCWYAQKFTSEELKQLEAMRLINAVGMPDGVAQFTSKG